MNISQLEDFNQIVNEPIVGPGLFEHSKSPLALALVFPQLGQGNGLSPVLDLFGFFFLFWLCFNLVDVLDFFLQVVDLIVEFYSFVGGLAHSNQVEVISDENDEGDAHDQTHDDQEEEDGFGHE